MLQFFKDLPLILSVLLASWLHWRVLHSLFVGSRDGWRRTSVRILVLAVMFWMGSGFLLDYTHFEERTPYWFSVGWVPQLGNAWAFATVSSLLIFTVFSLLLRAASWRRRPLPPEVSVQSHRHDPPRRAFLKTAATAAVAIPFGALGYGAAIGRRQFYLREVAVPIRGLPKEFEGFRMVQISDIHLSPLLDEADLEYVIAMANDTNADLGLITGDLITGRPDAISLCLRHLSHLRAKLGSLGCNGNHEWYAEAEAFTKKHASRFNIDVLRHESRRIRRGSAEINFAGVDHQWSYEPYLPGAEELLAPGMTNILLSHNPDVFPVAARQGWDLTVSGHTHGGQVTMEIYKTNLTPIRLMTPYIWGLYQQDHRSIYVTSGIGTVGVPMRIGAPPEVTLLTLCAT